MEGNVSLAVTQGNAAVATEDFTSSLVNQWLTEQYDINELTRRNYRAGAKGFIEYLKASGTEISEAVIVDYKSFLVNKFTPATAKLKFTICRKLTAWLAKRGYIARNFADGLKGVKLSNDGHSRDALTDDEVDDVLESLDTPEKEIEYRNKALLHVLLNCGLRACECTRANIGDIQRRRGVWTLAVWGKGRAGRDSFVILPDETKAVIDEYLKVRGKGGKLQNSEPLFSSTARRNKGQRLQPKALSRICKEIFRNAGIDSPKVTCHSCRHTCATIALENNVDIDSVSKNLRHRSIEVTEIYRHDEKLAKNITTRTVASVIYGRLKQRRKKNS